MERGPPQTVGISVGVGVRVAVGVGVAVWVGAGVGEREAVGVVAGGSPVEEVPQPRIVGKTSRKLSRTAWIRRLRESPGVFMRVFWRV
jgi:hypothetical protein